MADDNQMQLDITPLRGIFSSIQTSLDNQTTILREMIGEQKEQAKILQRQKTLQDVTGSSSSSGGILSGTGKLAGGIGGGIGSALGGVGGLLGGLGAGLGGAAAGIGTGIGVAAGGLGVFLAGGGYLLEKLEEFDGAKIRENLLELVHIKDDFDGMGNFFLEGGLFGTTMLMIGTGLAAFAIGAGAADVVTKFETPGWPEKIKNNVATLLSIGDLPGFNTLAGLDFAGTMLGLGTGLAAFALGKGVGVVVEGVAGAVEMFTGDEFAQSIYDQVATLLSIMSIPNVGIDTLGFVGTMVGLSAGLAAFAIGKGAGVIVEGFAESLEYFTGESFAQGIYDEVATLLSIMDIPNVGADTLGFVGTMVGLSAGLAAFAFGKSANTIVDGADKALAYFTEDDNFADRIYNQVSKLLSIMDIPGIGGDTVGFIATMGGLAAGILAFTGGEFLGTLANAGTEILGFFGVDSPFDQIMDIARNADELTKGANALDKITTALSAFGNITISKNRLDFVQLAEDLGRAVPFLDALANGGEVEGSDGWFTSPIVFPKGILDPSLRLDEMADAISKVNYVLGVSGQPSAESGSPSAPPAETGSQNAALEALMAATAASAAQAAQAASAAAASAAIAASRSGGSVVNNVSTTNITSDPIRSLDPALPGIR